MYVLKIEIKVFKSNSWQAYLDRCCRRLREPVGELKGLLDEPDAVEVVAPELVLFHPLGDELVAHALQARILLQQDHRVGRNTWKKNLGCCGSGIFIPDLNLFRPGSRIRMFSSPDPGSQIRIKEFKYFDPKKWFLSSRIFYSGC